MQQVLEKIAEVNKEFGDLKSLSVSKCISYLGKPFDAETQAKKCSDKGFDDPNSKYYQMTAEDIIKSWNEKADASKHYGSLLDDYVGLYFGNTPENEMEMWKLDNNFEYDERLQNNIKGFEQFISVIVRSTDFQYVGREIPLYIKSKSSDNIINGRLDCLFYSPSQDMYLIIDWKTTENIETSNRFQKMLGPLYNLDKCTMNEYTTQLQFYKKALVETYGITDFCHVNCYVCQTTQSANANGMNYNIYRENFQFNPNLLDKVIDFCSQKDKLTRLEHITQQTV